MLQVKAAMQMVMGKFTAKGGRSSPYLAEKRLAKVAEFESTNSATGVGRWKGVLWNAAGGEQLHAYGDKHFKHQLLFHLFSIIGYVNSNAELIII